MIYLSDFEGAGPFDDEELSKLRKWLREDWEAKDIGYDAVDIIERLLATIGNHKVLYPAKLTELALDYGKQRLEYLQAFNVVKSEDPNFWEESLLTIHHRVMTAKRDLLLKAVILAKVAEESEAKSSTMKKSKVKK